MKKIELFKLQETLNQFKQTKSTKFAYAILKNTKMVDTEINLLRELSQPQDKFLENRGR